MSVRTTGLLSPYLLERRLAAAKPWVRGRVLDVGSGRGELARWVPVEDYLGTDFDSEALAAARKRYPAHHFIEDPLPAGPFDTIVALSVIEHVADPATFLTRFRERLTPRGRVVLSTPHPQFEWVHKPAGLARLVGNEPSADPGGLIDKLRIETLARQAELRVVHYRRFLFGANQLVVLSSARV